MESYHEAYDRYKRRINPFMLNRFEDKRKNFDNSLKLFGDHPTRLGIAYQMVRKELQKYPPNTELIAYLDKLAERHEYTVIGKFLR